MSQDISQVEKNNEMMGGRRHRKQGHKTRKEPNVLKSWRKFVRKVQHEEHLSYPKAMKRASARKREWQRGGATDDDDIKDDDMGAYKGGIDEEQNGGRKRRSRRQRGGNAPDSAHSSGSVEDFDNNWNQYGKVGGSRKKHSRRRRRR